MRAPSTHSPYFALFRMPFIVRPKYILLFLSCWRVSYIRFRFLPEFSSKHWSNIWKFAAEENKEPEKYAASKINSSEKGHNCRFFAKLIAGFVESHENIERKTLCITMWKRYDGGVGGRSSVNAGSARNYTLRMRFFKIMYTYIQWSGNPIQLTVAIPYLFCS